MGTPPGTIQRRQPATVPALAKPQFHRRYCRSSPSACVGALKEGEKGAQEGCVPFAWLERNTAALIIVNGVPPTAPSIHPWEPLRPRLRFSLPGPSSARRAKKGGGRR